MSETEKQLAALIMDSDVSKRLTEENALLRAELANEKASAQEVVSALIDAIEDDDFDGAVTIGRVFLDRIAPASPPPQEAER